MSGEQNPSPREELAELSAGLLAHAHRLRLRGTRKLEFASLQPASSTREEAPRAATAVPPVGREAGVPAHHDIPRTAAPLIKDVLTPSTTKTVPTALDAAMIQAREIRARAQACSDLPSLRAAVATCTACSLCKTRTQTVFMDGTGRVPVMFIGEAPGANEDKQGVPFVGRAGELLTDIITKGMKLRREDVVIANVLKCRPPENRDPSDVEKALCTPWLDRQIELVNPKVLIPLGAHAAKHVLGVAAGALGALRARVHERGGRKIVPTFHPAYLLRSPGEKAECWKDIQLAMKELGMSIPARAGNSREGPG